MRNIINYTIGKDTLIIGERGEQNANDIVFNGFTPLSDDNTIFFVLDELTYPLMNNTVTVTFPMTSHSGLFVGQLVEKNAEGFVVNKSPVFKVKVTASADAMVEVTDPRFESLFEEYTRLYNEMLSLESEVNELKADVIESFEQIKAEFERIKNELAQDYADTKSDLFEAVRRAIEDADGQIARAKENALSEIANAKTNAVSGVNQARDNGIGAIGTAKDNAITEVDRTKTDGINAIESAKQSGVDEVNRAKSDIEQKKTEVIGSIEQKKTESVNAVEQKKTESIEDINRVIEPFEAEYGGIPAEIDDLKSQLSESIVEISEKAEKFKDEVFGGFAINKHNILEDYTMQSATPLDSHTEVLNPTEDSPSNIIHISSTESGSFGFSIDMGTLFNPFEQNTYHLHFKVKCIRNNAYAYQTPRINFAHYLGSSLKRNYGLNLPVPSSTDTEENAVYKDYHLEITMGTSDSNFNKMTITTNMRFDYWFKDFYIVKGADDPSGYWTRIEPTKMNALIDSRIEAKKTTLKLGVIGDSISDPNVHHDLKWHKYLHDNNGYEINCVAVSGSGYFNGSLKGGTRDHQFYNQALRLDNDCDIVIVFGGLNDAGLIKNGDVTIGTKKDSGTTTIGGCINTMLNNILSVNPLVHIAIAMPTPWEGLNPMIPDTNEYYNGTIGLTNLIKEICEYRSIPCLDLFHGSGLRPWISAFKDEYYVAQNDGTHPNAKGHEQFIYPHMREFLKEINWQNI